jgi:hypothetical protein
MLLNLFEYYNTNIKKCDLCHKRCEYLSMHNWAMMSINPHIKNMDMNGLCHEFLNDKDEHGKHHCRVPFPTHLKVFTQKIFLNLYI